MASMLRNGCLSLLLFVLVGCGSRHHGPTVHERRAAIRAVHAQKYGSSDGFQSTSWGMTRDQVRAMYPGTQETSRGDLVLTTALAEHPAQVFFLFADGRLGSVFVRFATPSDVRNDHQEVVELLTSKYGRAAKRGSSRRVQRYRESLDLAWLLSQSAPPVPSNFPAATESGAQVEGAPPDGAPINFPAPTESGAQVAGAPPDGALANFPAPTESGAQVAGAPPDGAPTNFPAPTESGARVSEGQPPLVEATTAGDSLDEEDSRDTAVASAPEESAASESEAPELFGPISEPEVSISRRGFVVVANWKAWETTVRLVGYQFSRERLLTLHYESPEYAEAIRDGLERLQRQQRRSRARDF
ncbi:hypothetical protein FJV41_12045 [Myxococcus llanfairpwllgwyngyllgogerychwyrndrobwllllantysiliogogogochensis]|uniref:Lipoprotein n=1 Tax=Myxococcus llanfairpwllgwyngyllgogerychwyrndrobwllllantysiliogogogochensis TaxID=2590453 RepID=A0A540X378_9BACT|nr:hypothetical protein [Myxococcus llanfairpwllgwyngyllgogerychwyrndrobwllllantysiliogogogochensis]TQF15718.1 hypothetical protein FJV41_12045 [Myxococcus llanfairpwllgwyngyllgogerychwyrndrobwllllantysiliogogogochensis]